MELEKSRATSAAVVYAKRIVSCASKAKSIFAAIKSKTEAIKARFLVLSLVRNAKKPCTLLVALSHKIHPPAHHGDLNENATAVGSCRQRRRRQEEDHPNASSTGDLQCSRCCYGHIHQDEDGRVIDDDRPEPEEIKDDLEQLGDPDASVIDLVRNSKEEVGENFSLEAEIDHVADLFIMKFHNKMRMQKLESFKRYQQMLERGAD